jgi:hypothetical protein
MANALTDTDSETARVHLDLLRSASPRRRLDLALSLSRSVIALSRHRVLRGSSPAEVNAARVRFVELSYGAELATAVRERLRAARS